MPPLESPGPSHTSEPRCHPRGPPVHSAPKTTCRELSHPPPLLFLIKKALHFGPPRRPPKFQKSSGRFPPRHACNQSAYRPVVLKERVVHWRKEGVVGAREGYRGLGPPLARTRGLRRTTGWFPAWAVSFPTRSAPSSESSPACNLCILLHSARSSYKQHADIHNTSFLSAIMSTSTRMHADFWRLLFHPRTQGARARAGHGQEFRSEECVPQHVAASSRRPLGALQFSRQYFCRP
jgi:hypothetical protein